MNNLWTIPNFISLWKVPIGVGVVLIANGHGWGAAFAYLFVGLTLDAADGIAARLLGQESDFGRDFLEPATDFFLCGAALVGLFLGDVWSWWALLLLFIPAGVMQVIHWKRNAWSFMRPLKRVQHVLHPLYAVLVMAGLAYQYAWLAADGSPVWRSTWLSMLTFALLVLSFTRRNWIVDKWHEGATA